MSSLTLRPYQVAIVNHILHHPRCGVYAGMGLGKTVSTLMALECLNFDKEAYPALVIAPLRVAASTWPNEVKKWAELRHVRVRPIVGSEPMRRFALATEAEVYTINYENLPWLVEQFKGRPWPFKVIVADESTRLKSFRITQGGKRAHALAKVAHKTPRFIELTGTPAANGLMDLYGQVWFLDKGERLGTSFDAFRSRWFKPIRVGNDAFAVRWEPYPHTQSEIQDRLKDLCVSLNAADYFDLEEPITNIIKVKLPEKARRTYDAMEKELFAELASGEEVEALNGASRVAKCLQLASGAVYLQDSTEWEEIHKAKIEALESVLEEAAGTPVLVSYHWKHDLVRLKKAFPKGRHLDKDPQTIDDWNMGKIPLLFAHPQSAGHGLNLQDGGNILVFFSHWWSLEEHQQIIERIGPVRQLQAGHKRPVFIHHLVGENTLDELVIKRRDTKAEIQDILMEALKHGY